VTGLAPDTTYYFRIRAKAGDRETVSDTLQANTTQAPAPGAAGGYDVAVIHTDYGDIFIRFDEEHAPRHAANFKKLARLGFYDGTTFHRVIPDFVIQGGDPNSKDADRSNDGVGGPGYTIPAEIHGKHVRGAVAAARMPDDVNPQRRSSGSQFYICVAPTPFLDGSYTVFGNVVKGMEVADEITKVQRDQNDNPLRPVPMKKVEIRHVNPGETL
jgi:cyclophilin family peptidyl-prolyl cis-trans isomerase